MPRDQTTKTENGSKSIINSVKLKGKKECIWGRELALNFKGGKQSELADAEAPILWPPDVKN